MDASKHAAYVTEVGIAKSFVFAESWLFFYKAYSKPKSLLHRKNGLFANITSLANIYSCGNMHYALKAVSRLRQNVE